MALSSSRPTALTPLTPPTPLTPLTIASVPAGHVYVQHIAPVEPTPISPVRLPDPKPQGAATTEQWWPPVMLEPAWAAEADFDVFHTHFGFDARTPAQLQELLDVLHARDKPLVHTVHDLRNPHHEDRSLHDAQLDVLVRGADEVLTLTDGAAGEIWRRWRRRAIVIPHPHIVPLAEMSQGRSGREPGAPFRVGLHVKSCRAGMAPMRVLPTLIETVGGLEGATLQVNAHRDVMGLDASEPSRHDAELADLLRTAAAAGLLELQIHDHLCDSDLWAYLRSLDVSVLPYRFGTHSGWLEACRDVGTRVVAPTCGYYADQGPVLTYEHDEDHFDAASMRRALIKAYAAPAPPPTSADWRRHQRRVIATAHDLVYRAALVARAGVGRA